MRIAFGFRRPCPAQAAALQPLWLAALRLSATPAGGVDLYVQPAGRPNAYAAGGRSVAVTTRVLEDYRAGRLSESQILAVLVHELGNHATGATRPMLIAMWFRAPWRVTAGLLTGLAGSLSRRPSQRTMQMMLFLGITVALVRALHHGYWMVGGVLAALALSTVICPLADAAVSQRAEFAADPFAADHGRAQELVAALRALDVTSSSASGWSRRLLASHPASDQRISALLTVRVGSEATDQLRSGAATRRPAAA